MRLSEVPFAAGVEQILDSIKVEKERVAAAAGEKSVGARLDDIRLGAERDLGVGDYLYVAHDVSTDGVSDYVALGITAVGGIVR